MLAKLFQIGYYALIALLVLFGVLLVGIRVSFIDGYELKIVQSGSMEPTITTGSLILIGAEDSYTTGDIITFGADTRRSVPTTHRIIRDEIVEGEVVYFTKGDANEDADTNPVEKDDVIGRVIVDVPYLGYLLDFARKPLGFVLLIVVPAVAIVFDEAMTIFAEVRGKKKEEEGDTEKT